VSRELLILRHAKSAWDTDAASDFDRPLARRGRKAAPRVGRFMRDQGLVPDYIFSSPAERAKQTVCLVCDQLDIDHGEIHWDSRIYGAGVAALIGVLRSSPEGARRVMIAGHNPGLEYLLEAVCRDPIDIPFDRKLMPTAALAQLAISTEWKDLDQNAGCLISLTRARSLSA
jgi:phosphohistidine phosphatase